MIIKKQILPLGPEKVDLLLPTISKEQILFFDIETTGFSFRNTMVYLIGAAYYKENQWNFIQWICEKKEDEKELLMAFYDFSLNYSVWIHFNADHFDLPYLKGKYLEYDLKTPFESITSIDLYRKLLPYKKLLHLPSLKQTFLERYFHIERKDTLSGEDLIPLYKKFVGFQDDKLLEPILQHNREDILGLLKLLPLLSYQKLFTGAFDIETASIQDSISLNGVSGHELILTFKGPFSFLDAFRVKQPFLYLFASNSSVKLKVDFYEGSLKYFYDNYKDYYYLPLEDTAIHKSIASYVDKEYREQAKAGTCYTKKEGCFLPQFSSYIQPAFYENLKSSPSFFEYQEKMIDDSTFLNSYAQHLLHQLTRNKNDEKTKS